MKFIISKNKNQTNSIPEKRLKFDYIRSIGLIRICSIHFQIKLRKIAFRVKSKQKFKRTLCIFGTQMQEIFQNTLVRNRQIHTARR